ncbi:Hydroxycarboxylic acid receptor 2 [Dissostichus eleginoides]|uniref:Hydroxycarboxylic acid receptor 2 n=1 Tax=Dissostichus eleginoides TaxID=100907 RepID=A0AAD9EWM9_DISEL|nr:Hydroxycarboxylic acid receptor 2 [Dissostichus eleginoides]
MLTELNVTTMLNFTTAPPVGGCPPVGIQLEGLLPPVLTIDVTLGLLGNAVALWIFCFKVKKWNPNTLFLFNLVIADFLALHALMTVVAIYRYFKVVHPHHRVNLMTRRQAAFVSLIVWFLVIGPRVPMLAFNHIRGAAIARSASSSNPTR